MKKLLRIAVVLGLALCLSVSAFAAGSVSGTTVGEAVTSDGEKVEVTETPSAVTPTTADAAAAVEGVKAEDLTVSWTMDLHVEIPAGGSVTITFDVPAAGANQNVYVLHYNGTKWEQVGAGKGKTVTATFTSLSPVSIVIEKENTTPSTPTTPETPYIPGVGMGSPTTGEGPALMVAAAIVLLAGVVAVVAMKKREEV